MINFDKKTSKVLKTIYKTHNGISYEKLLKKFHIPNDGWFSDFAELIYLFHKEGYISCEELGNTFSIFDATEKVMNVSPKAIFLATPRTKEFFQNRTFDLIKWLIPTILSLISLVTGIIF